MFINQEAFNQTVPNQKNIKEDNMWFLKTKDGKTAYIFIIPEDKWQYGKRKTYSIESFKTTEKSQISVLGHNGKVLEYEKDINPAPSFKQTIDGIELSVTRSQRIYNNRSWNNPIVVKITELIKGN